MNFHSQIVPLVPGRSYAQIEKEAMSFLSLVSPQSLLQPGPVPILEIFENKMDAFHFQVLIGKNIQGLGGFTDVTRRFIQISSATYRHLEKGDPQAKFTVAHEFGHMRLHAQHTKGLFAPRSQLRPFEDPEWQANAFSAAILMPYPTMKRLFEEDRMSVEETREIYQVSWAAAQRRVQYLQGVLSCLRTA